MARRGLLDNYLIYINKLMKKGIQPDFKRLGSSLDDGEFRLELQKLNQISQIAEQLKKEYATQYALAKGMEKEMKTAAARGQGSNGMRDPEITKVYNQYFSYLAAKEVESDRLTGALIKTARSLK